MKNYQSSIFAFILTMVLGIFNLNAQTSQPSSSQNVDLSSSLISWKAYKVGGSHEGNLSLNAANLIYDNGVLTGGSFTIDMTSIDVTDLEGEYKQKLIGHLASPDFFSVETHPTATFTIKNVYSRGAVGDYKIVGDLTIKGITKELKFNALFDSGVATAALTIDRTDFDIKYGSSTFLGALGDKTIYDDFELNIKLVSK